VIDRNWRCPQGELDLVLAKPGLIVFAEVKARASAGFGGPAAAVDHRKQQRLRRLAATWLAERRPGHVDVRFDVVEVVGAKVHVIDDAF
jgi:putative endonuclease